MMDDFRHLFPNGSCDPGIIGPAYHLLEKMSGIRFVLKDLEGRYLYVNRCWLETNGLKELGQVVGKTAADLFPVWRAGRYLREDQRVITEGMIYDYEEFLLNSDGELERWRTVKAPWMEEDVIRGYVNIGTRLDSLEIEQRSDEIPDIIRMVASRACEPISIEEMAKEFNVSKRTLERKFKEEMQETLGSFRLKCRTLRAKRMLREGKTAADVATACGFCDQSHFSKVFKKQMGQSPKAYQLSLSRKRKEE
ncbi:helix-turn-helix domain-containing protein [Verrucomicrobiaceae bacterium N1E253]|uniref:Helix-turn-helix domain-containing protein n=1 Tax=Oceaniferula marina TaxID=2748318 RepID=A0A851GKH6_9BACT|nr:helix-turn-helix domain-containing protein [Oceaniferula marina]NWK55597.1 helix-turn-helix domain-containing protein [Oceaniferula marina]